VNILTHYSSHCPAPWIAVDADRACDYIQKMGYTVLPEHRTDIGHLMGDYCAILDCAGLIHEGATEAEVLHRVRHQCRRCGAQMKPGIVLVPSVVGSEDFGGDTGQPGTTLSEGPSDGHPRTCIKCSNCGHSFIPGATNSEASQCGEGAR
jgi:hypothetical protein